MSTLAAPLMLIGIGQAFVMIPLSGIVLTGVPGELAGVPNVASNVPRWVRVRHAASSSQGEGSCPNHTPVPTAVTTPAGACARTSKTTECPTSTPIERHQPRQSLD